MAMDLELLRSKCHVEMQDHNPGKLMPAIDREIKRALVALAKKIGGIRLEVTIPTVANQRTYGLTDNFPVDCIGIYQVNNSSKSGQRIYPITKKDRFETTSTGSPNGYYIYNRREIGYDSIPSEVENILISYLGYGEAPSVDADNILVSLPQTEDDTLWDCVVFEVTSIYYRRKKEFQIAEYYNKKALKARYDVMSLFGNMNMDESFEVKVNGFPLDNRSTSVNLERFANDGDVLTIMGY